MFSPAYTPPKARRQRGNVFIYVLIAIALFGALTLILARQNKQSENQSISDEQLVLQMNELLEFSASAHRAVETMISSGVSADQIIYLLPSHANFATTTPGWNVFHPTGGGLTIKPVNTKIFTGTANNPVAGWYMGRFNNVEGTPTSAQEIIVTAHQISKPLCAALNKKLTGSNTIPALGANPAYYLIGGGGGSTHSLGNGALTQAACATCYDKTALCVRNNADTAWSFYTILAVQ